MAHSDQVFLILMRKNSYSSHKYKCVEVQQDENAGGGPTWLRKKMNDNTEDDAIAP